MRKSAPLELLFAKVLRPTFLFLRDAVNRFVEWRNGISTRGVVALEELGLETENRRGYKPTEWTTLRRILRGYEIREDDVFIDFGSGLGRVVFQAARYPFKRVIGVELSAQLHGLAEENISRNRGRLRCEDVDLVNSDVLHYEIPDDVTFVFFANPFTGPIFASVVDRLLESFDRRPRRMYIIYRNPVEHDYLLSTGRVRPVRHLWGMRPTRSWSASNSTRMYAVHPPGGVDSSSEHRS